MVARRYDELECWQLADSLKHEVYEFTGRPLVKRDYKFCDQIRESARSAPSNIAEGFARFRPADFARFLEFARASLAETDNHLRDARALKYLNDDELKRIRLLAKRAAGARTKLLLYLRGRGK